MELFLMSFLITFYKIGQELRNLENSRIVEMLLHPFLNDFK